MRNVLQTKEVNFNGDTLLAVQNEHNEIYVGVSYICNGIGLSKSQKDTQIQKIQTDELLKIGCLKFQAGVFDPNNTTICIMINFLPLWLAKISITPAMKKTNPVLVEKLINYQIKAKDVLAAAFLPDEVKTLNPYELLLKNINENQRLLTVEQSKINDKLIQHIEADNDDKKILNDATLSIGYELENIRQEVKQEIKDRTSYIPVRPIVSKRLNSINKARFNTIDKYTQGLNDESIKQNFTSRINEIVSNIINEKWNISKIKSYADEKSNFFSGDSAFLHDICVTVCKYYDGLKIS